MKLFRYEGYKVVISEEAFALKVFRQIWNRDRSVNKDKAIMELGYVYFLSDPRSDYQYIVDEDERSKAIIEGEGLPSNWKPDKVVTEAITFYKSLKSTSALLLEDTRAVIDNVRKTLRKFSFDDMDDKDRSLQGNIIGDDIAIGYKFNTIKIDDKECLMLFDQDISFIVEKYEEVEDPTGPHIIQPDKPKIIV